MICTYNNEAADPMLLETNRQSFFHIASRDNTRSPTYHRDLPFLMDASVRLSEFRLALDLGTTQKTCDVCSCLSCNEVLLIHCFYPVLSVANEIITNRRFKQDKTALPNILHHLSTMSNKAIKGNEGHLNTILLGQVISFFNVISPQAKEFESEFDIVAELSNLLARCCDEVQNNPHYSPHNIDDCITTISEEATPAHSLEVLYQFKFKTPGVEQSSSSLVAAVHASLIRGAREGVQTEVSGSLLRIQRAREEGRRPVLADKSAVPGWDGDQELGYAYVEEDEMGGFVWPGIIDVK